MLSKDEKIPVLSTNGDGETVLCPKTSGGKGMAATVPAHLQPEQAKQEVIDAQKETLKANGARVAQLFDETRQKIQTTLSAKEFDKIRALLDEFRAAI
jgi:hypothetical protein